MVSHTFPSLFTRIILCNKFYIALIGKHNFCFYLIKQDDWVKKESIYKPEMAHALNNSNFLVAWSPKMKKITDSYTGYFGMNGRTWISSRPLRNKAFPSATHPYIPGTRPFGIHWLTLQIIFYLAIPFSLPVASLHPQMTQYQVKGWTRPYN